MERKTLRSMQRCILYRVAFDAICTALEYKAFPAVG